MAFSRREVLRVGAFGAMGVSALGARSGSLFGDVAAASEGSMLAAADFPVPFQQRFVQPPLLRPVHWEYDEAGRLVRQFYHLTARETAAKVLPRLTTRMWGYNGLVPGPTIKVRRGVETVVRVRNQLPARHPLFGHEFTTSTHLHGSASLPQYDGYADDVTPPGFYKDYRYPNHQPARTIWYHDHAVHATAQNAYSGLAAQYHIHDPVEQALLPQGEFDIPLTVTDALFSAEGELAYHDDSDTGLYGDVIMVNGRPWPVMRVQKRVYRFRFLTASVSRSYRFRLSTGDPVHVVATDGGLMPATQTVTEWRQGSAERYEVLIDFRGYRPGQRVVLENLSNDNNRDYDHTGRVMAFDVLDDASGPGVVDRSDPTWDRIPERLAGSHTMRLTAASAVTTRHLEMGRQGGEWAINDKTWADVTASGFQSVLSNPDVGDVELWTIENKSGGWFHPTHIHLVDFRLLDRNGSPPLPHELGPKDVVYIGENETVRVVAQFGDPTRPHIRGRYMVHCHNLVHEDHDMMHQFAVGWKPGERDDAHPVTADPCKFDDLPSERGVAPGAPGAPEAAPAPGAVELSWDGPDDDGDDAVTGFRVRGYSGDRLMLELTVPGRRRHTVTDLEPQTAYTFTVAAVNGTGTGPQSPHSRRVTPRREVIVPGAPEIGRATAAVGSATVSWRAPASAGGSRITGYQVRAVRLGGTSRVSTRLVPASDRRITFTGLAGGEEYVFEVRAVNAAGAGRFSGRSNAVAVRRTDRRRPRAVALAPAAGATGVRRRAVVTAEVTEPVTGVSGRTVTLRRAGGRRVLARVRYDPVARRVTVNPRRRLSPDTRYEVRLSGRIRDEAGNRLAPARWTFTTAGRR